VAEEDEEMVDTSFEVDTSSRLEEEVDTSFEAAPSWAVGMGA